MSDLTNPDVFLDFYSAFWTRFFKDAAVVRGLAHADALELQQIYVNFLQTVGNLSINTIQPFDKELVVPVVLRKSTFSDGPDVLRYGAGVVFGEQPADTAFREGVVFTYGGLEKRSGLYYVGIPQNLKNVGHVILNRLVEPSVLLARDSDFIITENIIVFKRDPFANPLIPKRLVAGEGSTVEEEIVLWIVDGQFDRGRLIEQYGYMFSGRTDGSEDFRTAIASLMSVLADGPSLKLLDTMVAVAYGQPVIRETTETVERVTMFGGKRLIITDAGTYQLSSDVELRPEVVAGAVLEAGSPLTVVTQVIDQSRDPNWWTTVPALAVGRDFIAADIGSLAFPNTTVKVELEEVVTLEDGPFSPARFFLLGKTRDIEKFWDLARTKSKSGDGLGDRLWLDAGLVNLDGTPDFEQDLYLNPLEFLTKRLIGKHLIVVKVRISQVNKDSSFPELMRFLQKMVPVWCALLVIIEMSFEDSYSFVPNGSGLVTANPVDAAALIEGDYGSFTGDTYTAWIGGIMKTPEALSVGVAPDTIQTTLDLGDAANNAAAYGSELLVVEEEVSTQFIDTCTP